MEMGMRTLIGATAHGWFGGLGLRAEWLSGAPGWRVFEDPGCQERRRNRDRMIRFIDLQQRGDKRDESGRRREVIAATRMEHRCQTFMMSMLVVAVVMQSLVQLRRGRQHQGNKEPGERRKNDGKAGCLGMAKRGEHAS